MGSAANDQYVAIDFLHADFRAAAECASILVGGELQYALSQSNHNLCKIAVMERYTVDDSVARLSLIAKIRHDGTLNPDALRASFADIGNKQGNKADWGVGTKIRIAKLFLYGTDILMRLEHQGKKKMQTAAWLDQGDPDKKNKMPATLLGKDFFSINTSRKDVHWIAPVDEWALIKAVEHTGRTSGLATLALERV